jgi:MSHA pilin protein MshD
VNAPHRVRGVTLIELVFTIAILGLAASAVLGVMNYVSRGSADALVAQQAEAIANAYLQRALASTFAGVTAFNGINDPDARDAGGGVIPSLTNYSVTVDVANSGLLGGIPAANARRVLVTVTHDDGLVVTAAGYKTNYTP